MKTLSVEEATVGLGRWVELALAGEHIQIRKGDATVELRPTRESRSPATDEITPRDALRRLQEESVLTRDQADQYLRETHAERLAAENRRSS